MKDLSDSSFKFVHTADIHLDSPMRGLTKYEGVAVDRLKTATREAFSNLISRTIDARPEFIVIAGDLFDGDWRDYNTGFFFVNEMARLRQAGIYAYVLYGNHDAQSQITKRLRLPENVKEFDHESVQSHRLDGFNVVLHGRSYPSRDVQDNLSQEYPSPTEGMFNIGVLHTGLGGLGGHADYAPCTLDQLVNAGYDYWALGHVHTRQVLHEDPHVVFPGNLQGRHINEDGPRSASLVTVKEGRVVGIEEWECDVVRWHRVDVPVQDCTQLNDIYMKIQQRLTEFQDAGGGEQTNAVRVRLTGATHLHGLLDSSEEDLTLNVQSSSLDVGRGALWIQKVEVATNSSSAAGPDTDSDEAIGELQSLLGGATNNAELIQHLREDFAKLTEKLPATLKSELEEQERGYIQLLVNDKYEELLNRMKDRVMYEITKGGEDANQQA
ncbi:MAG: DNA repair exonuclease [Gammaproteobacteria bacterium]|nr:DNA repair exonuclease [Gammaproteobacteria bacterium]